MEHGRDDDRNRIDKIVICEARQRLACARGAAVVPASRAPLHRVVAELDEGTQATPCSAQLIHLPRVITLDSPLHEALDALVTAEQSGLPVLDPTGRHLTGWITHQSLLAAVHKAHTPAPLAP